MSNNSETETLKLTRKNGSFIPEVYDQVLVKANCGEPGHFKFQENGGHCLMCQREQQIVGRFRVALVNEVQQANLHDEDCFERVSNGKCDCPQGGVLHRIVELIENFNQQESV